MTIAGVILCGGKSRRMGLDKAGLRFNGRTWLDIAAQTLTAAGAETLIYSGRPDLPGGVADPAPDAGPAGGIVAALRHLGDRCDQVLFVPVDMPELPPEALTFLAAQPGAGAFFHGDPLPFALRLSPTVIEAAQAFVTTAARSPSVWGLLIHLGCVEVPAPPGLILRNLNTPEDAATLKS